MAAPPSAVSEREAKAAHDALHDALSREQQRLLLRFVDAENALRDEEMIDAFFSGFRLADGIRYESEAPYSYDAEDEARAREF